LQLDARVLHGLKASCLGCCGGGGGLLRLRSLASRRLGRGGSCFASGRLNRGGSLASRRLNRGGSFASRRLNRGSGFGLRRLGSCILLRQPL